MQRSETIAALAAALVAAQAEIGGAIKDKTNPHFRSQYADLRSVADACKPALNAHDIAFVQMPEPCEDGKLALTTMLVHKSGEWIAGTCTMPLPKNDPQGYGSALTYARRYGLAAIVGVCPEDDDAEGAIGRPGQPHPTPAKPPAPEPSDADKFLAKLSEAFDARQFSPEAEAAVVAATCKKHKLKRITDLPADKQQAMLKSITNGDLDSAKEKPKKGAA